MGKQASPSFHYFSPDGTLCEKQTNQRIVVREDGRIEQVCDHGIGHPIGHLYKNSWKNWMYTHGCCGDCSTAAFHLESTGKRETL